jgi:hypothetical protein
MEKKEFLQLKSLYVNKRTYWPDVWKYHWKITFSNEEEDEFTFNIQDEEMKKFLSVISKQVEKTAETFTDKLKKLFTI